MGGDLPRDSGQRVPWGCLVLLLWAQSHTDQAWQPQPCTSPWGRRVSPGDLNAMCNRHIGHGTFGNIEGRDGSMGVPQKLLGKFEGES